MYYTGERTNNALRIVAVTVAVGVTGVLTWTMLSCTSAGAGGLGSQQDMGASAIPGPSAATDEPIQPSPDPGPSAPEGGSGQPGGAGTQGGGGGGGDDGGGGGLGEEGGGEAIEVVPSPKDCDAYDPTKLATASAGASGWYLKSGTHTLALFDTYADALDGLKVARRHTKACFIGRGNDRPNPYAFITRYWEGNSGLPLGTAPTLDCDSYDKTNLTLKKDDDAWLLVSGDKVLARFDTVNDADRGRQVAKSFSQLCFIGRGNDRPNPSRYIVEHWRA